MRVADVAGWQRECNMSFVRADRSKRCRGHAARHPLPASQRLVAIRELRDGQMSSSCSSATVGGGTLFDSHSSGKAPARASALGTLVSSEQVAVQRGLAEFRSGRPVLFLAREPFVAMPIDGCDQRLLEAFRRTFNMAPLRLAITARRASALGLKTKGPITLRLNVEAEVSEILSLA